MFNLKIIWRNLQRGGIYSAINIGGLAILFSALFCNTLVTI